MFHRVLNTPFRNNVKNMVKDKIEDKRKAEMFITFNMKGWMAPIYRACSSRTTTSDFLFQPLTL